MALITCKSCGKKISDTAEKCVHCGAAIVIADNIENNVENNENEVSSPKQIYQTESKESNDFTKMSMEERAGLEREFLSQNPAAMKYRRIGFELLNLVSGKMVAVFFLMYIVFVFVSFLNGSFVYDNRVLSITGICLAVMLFGFCITLPLICTIVQCIRSNSVKNLAYNKKFQKWLKEEKNIEFSIVFKDESQKEIFEGIDLDVFNF